ncbi:MAG: adenylate/guanylate cyclase domain-containing protein, partial [Planctomycetota bacterium]
MESIACPSCGTEIPAAFKFCGACGHKLEEAPRKPVESAPVPAPTPDSAQERPLEAPSTAPDARDERREVSVMFADVSGFTAMSERLDPEAVHQIMNDCFDGLGHAIQEEDGHIDKYIGDNIMALFGAPVAHEDDPARAARAALAMQAFLRDFAKSHKAEAGVEFKMRIGIHCGLVLAGGVGSYVRRDYSVMGDAVNLASRLESSAAPGTILVSHRIRARTRGQFEFGQVQHLKVKGKEKPVEAYELLREVSDTEAHRRHSVSDPLIGRDEELRELTLRWEAGTARARWIEVRGPMGVGKTRLIEAAAATSADRRLLRVVARHPAQRRPFALARQVIHAVTHAVNGKAVKVETRDQFGAALAPVSDGLGPFLSALWYLAAHDRLAVPAPDPDPKTLRRTLERGMARLLSNLAETMPGLVLFLDSYELGDDASLALFAALAAQGNPLPMVVAARDEAPEPYGSDTAIRVEPLGDEAAGALLDRLVHGSLLPEGLRHDLLERAAGIPLFIEEMVRKLIDECTLTPGGNGGGWTCDPQATSAILPGSIMGAMVSRLDRLERPARDLLCQCAVQGIEFFANVAETVWQRQGATGEPLAIQLRDLEDHQLIARIGESGARWAFRQRLLHDACYQTLLKRDRKHLHADTAAALCHAAGSVEAVAPETLAHHYERAELWVDAAGANFRAGNRAAELYLNQEAVDRFESAIAAIARLEDRSELATRTAAFAHGGAARIHLRVGAYGPAEEHGSTMRELARRAADRAEANRLVAAAWLHTGRTEEAEEHLLVALAGSQSRQETEPDNKVAVLTDLIDLCHRAGRTEEALERLDQCRIIEAACDPATAVRLDLLEGRVAHTEGRFGDATALYGRAYDAAERLGSLSEQAQSSN